MKNVTKTKRKRNFKQWLGTLCILLCTVLTFSGCVIADNFNKGTITGEDSQGLKRVNTPWFHFDSSTGLFSWAFSPYSYTGENESDLVDGNNRYTYLVNGNESTTGETSTVIFTGDPNSIQYLENNSAYYLTPYTDTVTGTQFFKATKAEGSYQEELEKVEAYLKDPTNTQTSQEVNRLILWNATTGYYCLQDQNLMSFNGDAVVTLQDLDLNSYGFTFISQTETHTTYYNVNTVHGTETYVNNNITYINPAEQKKLATYYTLVKTSNYATEGFLSITTNGADPSFPTTSTDVALITKQLCYLAGFGEVNQALLSIEASEDISLVSRQQILTFTVTQYTTAEKTTVSKTATLTFASHDNGITYALTYTLGENSYTAILSKKSTTLQEGWINVADTSKYTTPTIAEDKQSVLLEEVGENSRKVFHVAKYNNPSNQPLTDKLANYTFVFLGNQTTNPSFVALNNTLLACSIIDDEVIIGDYSIYTTSSVFAYTQIYTQTETTPATLLEIVLTEELQLLELKKGATYTLVVNEDDMSFTIAETNQKLGDELSALLGDLLKKKSTTETKTQIYFTWNNETLTQRAQNLRLNAEGASFENHDIVAEYATGKYILQGAMDSNHTYTPTKTEYVKAFAFTYQIVEGGASNIVNIVSSDVVNKITYTSTDSATDSIQNYFTKNELASILQTNIANSKLNNKEENARVLPTVSIMQDGVEYFYYPVVVPMVAEGGADTNYQLTVDENKTVNIWFLQETTININGVSHTVLRKVPQEHIRARVQDSLFNTSDENSEDKDISSLIASNMYIEFSPRLTAGTNTRTLKVRALALTGTNRGNSAYSNNITYNAFKMSFTTYSPNSITIDYGELLYDANKYYFYNVNKTYDKVLGKEMVMQLTGFFAEGTLVSVSRTTPTDGQEARKAYENEEITANSTLSDYLRKTYSYALQSWSVNQKALNTFASSSALAFNLTGTASQQNIYTFMQLNDLLNDNVFFGVGTTVKGADVVKATPFSPYYLKTKPANTTQIADPSTIYVKSCSDVQGYNFYANYTKIANFSITGSVYNAEDLMGGASSSFAGEISYGLTTNSLTNNLNELNEFSMVGLSLEQSLYFKGVYDASSSASTSTGYGYYFFLSDYVKALEENIYQLPVIRTMGSISVFGDIESTGLIATKFHESTNLIVNVVAPSEDDPLPNGTSYEVIKSITSSVDKDGYVVTTVIISVLVPDDSMLLAYNIDTNSVGYSSTRSFADANGNVVVINENAGVVYGAILTYADGSTEVLKPTQVKLNISENDAPDTLTITHDTISESTVFTEVITQVSDSAIVAPVYSTGIYTQYTNSDGSPIYIPIYVTYDVQKTDKGLYFYTAPIGDCSTNNGSIDFYAEELALSYTCNFENSLKNLSQYIVSGAELEKLVNTTLDENAKDLAKYKHAFANLLGSRIVTNKYYFVKPLEEAKDALLSQQVQNGNVSKTIQVLTLKDGDKLYNGAYKTEEVLDGSYTFTATNNANSILYTGLYSTDYAFANGTILVEGGQLVNLASFGYATSANGTAVDISPLNNATISANFFDVVKGKSYTSEPVTVTADIKNFANITFTFTQSVFDEETQTYTKKTLFTKSINDPELDITFTYRNDGNVYAYTNAWIFVPSEQSQDIEEIPTYLQNNANKLTYVTTSRTYTSTLRYYYTTTDANGETQERELTAEFTSQTINVEEGVIVRKAVLAEDNSDIIVLGKHYIDGVTSRYNPTFSAWAKVEEGPETASSASIIGNKDGYYYLDYSSESSLSKGFPGVKYLDGAPYPNPVIIFNVRHKIDEHSEISVGLLVKNVYQAELLGSFADTSTSSTFMDFTSFAFRSSEENLENSELLYSHAYVLRLQNQGFTYLYTNILYKNEAGENLNTYIPLKIADIQVVENADGTYKLVYTKDFLAPDGSTYYTADDTVTVYWFNSTTNIYEEKTTFTKQEFEELVIWSTSSNLIDNVGYQDIHTYYEGSDGRIHFTSNGATDQPCYGLVNIGAGDIHNGNQYDYSEVLFAGTATAFRSTVPGLIDKIYASSNDTMFDPNIWGYFVNNMYPITISSNSDTLNSPYFVTNQETAVFVANPYLQFESSDSTSGVSSAGVIYRFKQWRIFERYNESIMYRAYDQEAAYSRYLNNAIFTFAPSTSGRYLILPVYERVYQVNVGTGVVGNAFNNTNNTTFTPNQGGSVTIEYDGTTGKYINLDGLTREEIQRKLFFIEYLDAFKQANISTIQTKTFIFAKVNESGNTYQIDILLDQALGTYLTYVAFNETTNAYDFILQNNSTIQSAYTVKTGTDEQGNPVYTNFYAYELVLDAYGTYYLQYQNNKIELTSNNLQNLYNTQGKKFPDTTLATFNDDILPNMHQYASVCFISYATVYSADGSTQANANKPIFFTIENNQLFPTYVVKTVAEDGTVTILLSDNKQAVAKIFTKDFNFVETFLDTEYIGFNNGWNKPNANDYENGEKDPNYETALKQYQTQVLWGTTYFDRDTQLTITARPALGYRLYNFYFAKYDETEKRYVFDASMTVNQYLIDNADTLAYSKKIIPAYYNENNSTYYFDKDYKEPVPDSYLDAVRGFFITSTGASGEYYYTQVYKNLQNDKYYFDSSFTILAKVNGAEVTESMVTEKTYISAITSITEENNTVRHYLSGVEVYLNPEDGNYYREISDGNYTVYNGVLTIQTLHENVAIVATFTEVYQQFIFAEPESASGIFIEDIYYHNVFGADKNNRTDAFGNVQTDPEVAGFSANTISIPLKAQAGESTPDPTTLYNLLVSGKYKNNLFIGENNELVSDYGFGTYLGKHISGTEAQNNGITLSNMNMYFDQDCEIFVVVRVNAENKLETHSLGTNPKYVIECVVEPTEEYLTQLQSGDKDTREKYTYYILRYTYNRNPLNPYYGYITHLDRDANIQADIANATKEEIAHYYNENGTLKSYIKSGSTNFINLSTIELYNITVSTNIIGTQASHDIVLGDFFAIAGYGTTQLLGFNEPTTYTSFTDYANAYGEAFAQYLQSFNIISGNAGSVNIYSANKNVEQLQEYLVNGDYYYKWQDIVAARDTGIIFSAFTTEENAGASYNPETGLFEQDGHYYRFMGWYERSLLHAYKDEFGNRVEIWSDYNYQESAGGSAEYSHMIIADANKQVMAVYKEVVPFAFTYNPEEVRINFSYTTDSLGNPFEETTQNGKTTLSGYVDVDFSMDVQIVPVGGYRYNNLTLSVNTNTITTWETYMRNGEKLDLTGKSANTNPEQILKETLTLQTAKENFGSIVYDGASNKELNGFYATNGTANFTLNMQEITPISIKTDGYGDKGHNIILRNSQGQMFVLDGKEPTGDWRNWRDDTQNPIAYDAETNTIAFYQDTGKEENAYTFEIELNEGQTLNGYFANNNTTKKYPTDQHGNTYFLTLNTKNYEEGLLLHATVSGTKEIEFDFTQAMEDGYITYAYVTVVSGKGYMQNGVFVTNRLEFTQSNPTGTYAFDNETHITIELYREVSINDTTTQVKWEIGYAQNISGDYVSFVGYEKNVQNNITYIQVLNTGVTNLPSTITPAFVGVAVPNNASMFAQMATPAWATWVTPMASRSLSLANPTFTAMLQNNEAVKGYVEKVSNNSVRVTFPYATLTITFNHDIVNILNEDGTVGFSKIQSSIVKAVLETNEGYVFENTNNTFKQNGNVFTLENVEFYNSQNNTYTDVFANLLFSASRTISITTNYPELEPYIGIYESLNSKDRLTEITYNGQTNIYLKADLPQNLKPYYAFEGWFIGNTRLSTDINFDIVSALKNYETNVTVQARFTTFKSVTLELNFLGLQTYVQPSGTLFTIHVQSGEVYLNNNVLQTGTHEISLSYFMANEATLRYDATNAQFTIEGANDVTYKDATYTFAGFTQNELLAYGSTQINQSDIKGNTSSTTNAPSVILNYVQNITFTLKKATQNGTAITSTRVYFEATVSYTSFPHLNQSYQVFAQGETIYTYYGANLTLSLYYDTTMFAYNMHASENVSNGFTFTEGNETSISDNYNKLTYNPKVLNTQANYTFTFTFNTFSQMSFEMQDNIAWQYKDTNNGWINLPENGMLVTTNLLSLTIRLQLLHTASVTYVLESITVNGKVIPVSQANITQENGITYYTFTNIPVTNAHISAQVTSTHSITLQRYINGSLQASNQLPIYLAHSNLQIENVPPMVQEQGVYFAPTSSSVYVVAEQNNAYIFAGFMVLSMQGEVLDVLPANTTDAYITFVPTENCIIRADYISLYSIATFTETRGSFTNTQVGGSLSVTSEELSYNQAIQNTPFTVAVQANAGFTTQAIVLTYVENGTTVTKIFTSETFATDFAKGTFTFTINNGNGTFDIPYRAEQITFTAIFAQTRNVTVTIQTTNDANGTVTINGQTVNSGQTLTFTYNQALEFIAKADQGYVFAGWFLDEYTPISYNETLSMLATEVWLQEATKTQELSIIAKFSTSIPSYNSHTSMSVAVVQADGTIALQTNTLEWLKQIGNEYGYVEKQGYTFIGWYQEIRTNISNYLPVSVQSTYTLPSTSKGEILMVAMYAQTKQTSQTFTYQTTSTTHTWESAVGYLTKVGNVQMGEEQQLQTNVTLPEHTNTQLELTNNNGAFLPDISVQPDAVHAGITIVYTQTVYELTVEVYLPDGSLATQEQLSAWLLGNGSGSYAQNSQMFVGLSLEGTNYAIASISNNASLEVGFQNTFTFNLTQNTTITYTLKDVPKVENPENGTEIVDGTYHRFIFTAPAGYILTEVTIGDTTYTMEQLKGLSNVQNLTFTYGYAYSNASTDVAGTLDPATMVTGLDFGISEEDFADVTTSVTLQQIVQMSVSTSLQNNASAMYYIPYVSSLNLTPWLNQYPTVNFAVYVNGVWQADSTNVTLSPYDFTLKVYFEEITSSEYTLAFQGANGITLPEGESLLTVNDKQYANEENATITLSTGTFYNIGIIHTYANIYTLQSMQYTNGLGEEVTVEFTQAQNNAWSYPAEGIQAGSTITFTIADQQNSFSIFIPIPWNELTQNESITNAQTLAQLLFENNNIEVLNKITFTLTQQSNGVTLVGTYSATLGGTLTLHPIQQEKLLEFLENKYTYVSTIASNQEIGTSITLNNFHITYYINYTQEKAVYLATNRESLNNDIEITIQTNDGSYSNTISLADFTTYVEGKARHYRFYIPANKIVYFTFEDENGNITNMNLFEIVMNQTSDAISNITAFLELYTEQERNIQNKPDAYSNIKIQLNGSEQELQTRSANLSVQDATVLFLDFTRMAEKVPDGYFIHGGVGSVITPDQSAQLHPNFSSTFNGGYYNFTTNGNYTVTQEKDSSYYIDTTTGLKKVDSTEEVYQPTTQSGGEVGVATNALQTITYSAQIFGATNTLVFKDTGEELTYEQKNTLKIIDNVWCATRGEEQAEVVVKSSRKAIDLSTFDISVNNQRLKTENTTQTYKVNDVVTLKAYKQNNYRFVGFIVYLANGTTINLPYTQDMEDTVTYYQAQFRVQGTVEKIEILYEGQISQITLRQVQIYQESFDPNATDYALEYNGQTPIYKGTFKDKVDVLNQAVDEDNANKYIAGNLSSTFMVEISDPKMSTLWQTILHNTFPEEKDITINTIVMAYYDGTTVSLYYFANIALNEEGIVDLQWIVISYLVTTTTTQAENEEPQVTHNFEVMNTYMGYTKGSLLVRESVTLSSYPYNYGKHIGWSLDNGLTSDFSQDNVIVTAQSMLDPSITETLTKNIHSNLGNIVKFQIPHSVTLFTYFTTMRYLVTIDFADMQNVTTSTYDANNTNYLVFDTSKEKYQEFFDSYYEEFGDYRVRIENGNQIVDTKLEIFAPSTAVGTIQLVRQSWLDMNASKAQNQLIMNQKFTEDYFGVRNQQFALRVPQCVTETTNLEKVDGSALYTYDMIDWGMYGASKQLSNFLQYFTNTENGLQLKDNLLTITYNKAPLTNYTLQTTQQTSTGDSTENNVNVTGTIAVKFYIYATSGTGFGELTIQGNPLLDSAYEIKDTVITYEDGSQKTFTGNNITQQGNVIIKDEQHNTAAKTSDTVGGHNYVTGFNQWIYQEIKYDDNGNPINVVEPENVTITFIQVAKSSNVNTSVNLGTMQHTYQLLGQVNGSNNVSDMSLSNYATQYLNLLDYATTAQNQSLLYQLFGDDWKNAEKAGTLGINQNGEYYANNSSIYSNYDITIIKNGEYHAQTARMWLDYYNSESASYYYTAMVFMQLYNIMLSTQLTDLYYQEGENSTMYSLKDNFTTYIEQQLQNPLTNAEKTVALSIDTSSLITANGNPVYFTGTLSVPNFYNINPNITKDNIEQYAYEIISAQDANDSVKLEKLWKTMFIGKLEIPVVYINIQSLYGSYFTQSQGFGIYQTNELLRILLTMDNSITLFDQVIINTAFNEQYQPQYNTPEANSQADRDKLWFKWWTIEEGWTYHPNTASKAYSYYFPGALEIQTTSQEQTLILRTELYKEKENDETIVENFTDTLRNTFAYAFPNAYAATMTLLKQESERSVVDFTTKNSYNNHMIMNFTLFNLKSISYDKLFKSGGVGVNISSTVKMYRNGNDTKTAYDDLCVTKIYEFNPVPLDIYWVRMALQVAEVTFDIVSIATGVGAIATALKTAAKVTGKVILKSVGKQLLKFTAKSFFAYSTARLTYSMVVKLPNPFKDPIADVKTNNPVYMDDIILVADTNGVPNYNV